LFYHVCDVINNTQIVLPCVRDCAEEFFKNDHHLLMSVSQLQELLQDDLLAAAEIEILAATMKYSLNACYSTLSQADQDRFASLLKLARKSIVAAPTLSKSVKSLNNNNGSINSADDEKKQPESGQMQSQYVDNYNTISLVSSCLQVLPMFLLL
jgi:hypothetical protein